MNRDLVRVTWVDNFSNSGWKSVKERITDEGMEAVPIQTVGWVIRETDKVLKVAASISGESDEEEGCDDVNGILKCCIVARDVVHAASRR